MLVAWFAKRDDNQRGVGNPQESHWATTCSSPVRAIHDLGSNLRHKHMKMETPENPDRVTTRPVGVVPLRFLPMRMRLISQTLALEGFAGPLWHSGFGVAINNHFPGVFELLFAEQARLGRLYALQPPITPVRPGEPFEIGVNLFGVATDHAIACAMALARVGETGLGERRGRFCFDKAWVAGSENRPFLDAAAGLVGWPVPVSPNEWLSSAGSEQDAARVELVTPLCIKENNQGFFGPLPFSQLVRRLHGRLAQLCESAGEAKPLARETAAAQLRAAGDVTLQHSALRWEEIKRRSSRTRHTMGFGGMTGSLVYRGDLAPFAGLLALGEIMQLGGKTAFGFGCIRIDISNEG